jgi:hypothetical protein
VLKTGGLASKSAAGIKCDNLCSGKFPLGFGIRFGLGFSRRAKPERILFLNGVTHGERFKSEISGVVWSI